jgi:hypothetical protein
MGCPAAVEQLCPAAESERRCPEVRVYLQRFVAMEPLMLRQHAARPLAAAIMQHEGDSWNTENVNLMLPTLWFGRETGPHAKNKEKRAEEEER